MTRHTCLTPPRARNVAGMDRTAIIELQRRLGVSRDGIIGPATLTAMLAALDGAGGVRDVDASPAFDLELELSALIQREGDYVNHPADKGGPTRWGITEAVARRYGYRGSMQVLPLDTAKAIYSDIYWLAPGFAQIAGLGMRQLAAELFDTGVNMGPTTQVRWLQRWLNALCGQYSAYKPLTVDGAAGAGTRAAIQFLAAKRGAVEAQAVLVRALNCSQGHRYLELAEGRSANQAFLWGWIRNRVALS